MQKYLLHPGLKVTLMYKGNAFVNTAIRAVFQKFGSTYLHLSGVRDEWGDYESVSANDVRPVTQGWYSTNPNKQTN